MKRRDEFLAAVHEHTTRRATAELLADAALFRIPSGPVLDGSTIPGFDHFVEREVFTPDPTGRFLQPRVPYRIWPGAPSVRACADRGRARRAGRLGCAPGPGAAGRRTPAATEGIRVVDCTAVGRPAATQALACSGPTSSRWSR